MVYISILFSSTRFHTFAPYVISNAWKTKVVRFTRFRTLLHEVIKISVMNQPKPHIKVVKIFFQKYDKILIKVNHATL